MVNLMWHVRVLIAGYNVVQLQCQWTQFVETVIARDENPPAVQFYTESAITDGSRL